MTYVVTEPCIRCKYTDCVEICPVDCFHEAPEWLVIDPDTCIDCALCVPECPVDAIWADDRLPEGQDAFLELNARLARHYPVLNRRKSPPADADEWVGVEGKRRLLGEGLGTGD